MYLEADSSNLIADTGWKPQVEFEEGIRRVIDFHKSWDVYK
jgi:nucleoside-diphosphate-sugar epimerase